MAVLKGPIEGNVWEDSGTINLGRVVGRGGTVVVQSDINKISYSVFDLDNNNALIIQGTPTVSSVIFNTPQIDALWTKDNVGYNFRHELPAAALVNGDRTYRVEYLFDPNSGEDFFLVYNIKSLNVHTS